MTIRKQYKQDAHTRGVVTWIAMTCIAAWATTGISQTAANAQVIDDVDPLLRDQILQDLDLADFSLQKLGVLDEEEDVVQTHLELDGQAVTMTLFRHSNRAPGFRVLVDDGTGVLEEIDPGIPQTYRGTVHEWPGSVVTASIIEGQLSAMIDDADEEWWIQPLSETIAGTDPTLHVFYRPADVLPSDGVCGVDDGVVIDADEEDLPNPPQGRPRPQEGHSPDGNPPAHQYDGGGPLAQSSGIHIAEIAFDVDHQFYQRRDRSATKVRNDIEHILNRLNRIYTRDAGICHSITTMIIRTTQDNDPYSGIFGAGNLLTALKNQWNENHDNIIRDTVHLMTGKDLNGNTLGIAYIKVICRLGTAYGLSNGQFGFSHSRRVALVAHELGHNWSADHCDEGGDDCHGRSGDCRIMCSNLGQCSGRQGSFSPESAACISDYRDNRSCLTDGCDCGRSFEEFRLEVPEDHNNIRNALERASCGLTISIRTGTYQESILSHEVFGGDVTLSARDGPVLIQAP